MRREQRNKNTTKIENYREKYGHNESSIPYPYDSSDEERLKWRNREEGKYDLPSELKPKKHLGINLNSQNREIMHSQLEKCVTTLKLKSYPDFMKWMITFFSIRNLSNMDLI